MVGKWTLFTNEELIQMVKTSSSYRDLMNKMGYAATSSSTSLKALKKALEEKQIDTSHFTGRERTKYSLEKFQYGKEIRSATLFPALEKLRGHRCECCGLEMWLGQPITLEIHHKDANKLNNTLDNLMLLCPNCHSQTDTWNKGRRDPSYKVSDEQFAQALRDNQTINAALRELGLVSGGSHYRRAHEIAEQFNIEHIKG